MSILEKVTPELMGDVVFYTIVAIGVVWFFQKVFGDSNPRSKRTPAPHKRVLPPPLPKNEFVKSP